MSRYSPVWTGPAFGPPEPTGRDRIGPDRTGPVRIGDAERDQAVSELGDHFVAGRLTREEFDERSDQATRARYAGDLAPLFADLPDAAGTGPQPGHRRPAGVRTGPPPFVWLVPVLMVGMILTAVLLTAPWILWVVFWIALFGGFRGGHGWHHNRYHR